jgi:anthranilate phosphoribosyltransferase
MSYARLLKQITRGDGSGRELAPAEAQQLFAAMLDGGLPELELGAALTALALRGESAGELLGCYQALAGRVHRLALPHSALRTVVLATDEGVRNQANLTPLVALALRRLGVPVLVHGALESGQQCVATAYIFRELGVLPCATFAQAQARFANEQFAFVPTAVLAPGLADLLALRNRLGMSNTAHAMAKLIDPFPGYSLRVIGMPEPAPLARMREVLLATGERALLLHGPEGEPFADPQQRPRIEYVDDGRAETLFDEEQPPRAFSGAAADAKSTAAYVRKALDGAAAMPMPIVNEIACCLYGAGLTEDLNQAKAIVAVEMHSLGVS